MVGNEQNFEATQKELFEREEALADQTKRVQSLQRELAASDRNNEVAERAKKEMETQLEDQRNAIAELRSQLMTVGKERTQAVDRVGIQAEAIAEQVKKLTGMQNGTVKIASSAKCLAGRGSGRLAIDP